MSFLDPLKSYLNSGGSKGSLSNTAGLGGAAGYNLLNPRASTGGFNGPQSISFSSGAPDYASLIENDPAFQQLKASLSAQGIADAAHLRGAIQQALIQFGGVPNLPSDVLNATGLDTAGTQTLAQNNPFSVLKQLAQQYQDQTLAEKNQLAARGILNSGETGYQLGRLGQANAQGQYNATNSLLGNIDNYFNQYAAGQKLAAQQLSQGAFTAEANQASMNPVSGTTTATYDPTTGLYRDANGSYYTQAGNPVQLPSYQPSSAPAAAPQSTTPTVYDPTKLVQAGQQAAA